MKERLVNLDNMSAALKPFLEQYLQEHGIDTSKNFYCLNPKHNETSPSMTCKQYPENAFCYGCGCTADIFAAAHYIEGKPIKGHGFVEDNVMYLAKKFGVQIELKDLTPEEVYEYKTYSAYALAAKLVSDPEFGNYSIVDKEIARRDWDKNKCAEWGIGTVSYKEYKSRMIAAGYDLQFLAGVDLDRSNLFNNNNLLFVVNDDFGRPVGFSAKNLIHNSKDSTTGPKYINTRGTNLECAIFKKGERLYGFDIARNIRGQLYIFEGQADVITARHSGLMNCCCTLGTAFTDHHVNLLKRHGIFNLTLVFDGDEAGQLAVQKALDDKLAKEKEFRVKLCQLPAGQDPDELLRTKGIDEFVRLKKWSAFEWRMMKFVGEENNLEEDSDKKRDIAEKMTQLIVSEKSHLAQEEMSKQVSKVTGYDLSTIISEVKRLRDEKSADVQAKKKAAIEALLSEVRFNPDDAEMALVQAKSAIDEINKSVQDEHSSSSNLSVVLSLKEKDESKTGDFAGFYMKPYGLGGLAARLDDDWKTDNLLFIGGSEQAGKTTLCTQMAYEIADDPRNNAMCIYHSIDDASRYPLYKWVCNATEDTTLNLNHVSNPNYWSKQEGYEFVPDIREKGYRKIIQMIKDERLVIKDSGDGQSITYTESLIKYYKDKYPDRNIVLFLDNFHKLPDFPEMKTNDRNKRLCNMLKNMTTQYHVTIVSTVEYRKLNRDEKPSNLVIAESRAFQYDATVIIHLHNDMHHKGADQSVLIHEDEKGNILPRIWVKFGKNKVSGYEGREFVDLFGYAGQVRAVELDTAIREQKERIQFLKDNRPSDF
jgi:DNA primase catalytic core